MSLESINSLRGVFGAAPAASKATVFGRQEDDNTFEATLKNSAGFGTKSDSGGVTNSIAGAGGGLGDLVSQLQFSFLKNNDSANGLSQRMSNALF